MRFQNENSISLRDLATNLVPFKNINYVTCSHTSFENKNFNTESMTKNLFCPYNFTFCGRFLQKSNDLKYMASCVFYRGEHSRKTAVFSLLNFKNKFPQRFLPWIFFAQPSRDLRIAILANLAL